MMPSIALDLMARQRQHTETLSANVVLTGRQPDQHNNTTNLPAQPRLVIECHSA